MISLAALTSKEPADLFVAMVSLEVTTLVGVIEDPIEVEPTSMRLGYPIEFSFNLGKTESSCQCSNAVIIPEFGIPEEVIIASDIITIHRGNSVIGQLYLRLLREITQKPPVQHSYGFVPRSQITQKPPTR